MNAKNAIAYYVDIVMHFPLFEILPDITLRGEIFTIPAPSQVHYVVVSATDGGQEPQTSSATVTVLVSDVQDEVPVFLQQEYQAVVQENLADQVGALGRMWSYS